MLCIPLVPFLSGGRIDALGRAFGPWRGLNCCWGPAYFVVKYLPRAVLRICENDTPARLARAFASAFITAGILAVTEAVTRLPCLLVWSIR